VAEGQKAGVGHGRVAPLERGEFRCREGFQDGGQALRALGVAVTGVMIEAGRMGKQQGGQVGLGRFLGFIARSSRGA
jgi:hypothetical protein